MLIYKILGESIVVYARGVPRLYLTSFFVNFGLTIEKESRYNNTLK